MRLLIISNRLPVKAQRSNDRYTFSKSEGGLATGLDSLEIPFEKIWIGWPGIDVKYEEDKILISKELLKDNYYPVFLTKKQVREYYEGYCNSKLWPLCHYFYLFIKHEINHWTAYKEVNSLFCNKVCEIIRDDDIVWVQDYQLMLLPKMIREKNPDVAIGYFHHIPFPSYELFRVLPERDEILKGLLGSDLIGFHTHEYMRHFISSSERVLDLTYDLDAVWINNREAHVDTFPMGINFDKFNDATLDPNIQVLASEMRKNFGSRKLILSVDRLDYSKGIINRLQGFGDFLKNNPQYHGKVTLLMIIVPSRDTVESYAELKRKVDQAIGSINGQYSNFEWTPINYFYQSFPFEELVSMYYIADVALVTPLRDGMNLIAKEYVACKREIPGVLILSEMAGASIELMDAIIINPNERKEIADSILTALEMPIAEQKKRMNRMRSIVSRQTVKKWGNDFVNELISIRDKNLELNKRVLSPEKELSIKKDYDESKSRLILLDYDGTLSAFKKRPEDASPDKNLLDLLSWLSSDKRNNVVISSGRDHKTLEEWFGSLKIGLAAEHGAFYKEKGKWHENIHKEEWNQETLDVFQKVTDKTPRSQLEIKNTAMVWHYRQVDPWLALIRLQQLTNALIGPCTRNNLNIVQGNKILEVKYPDSTKGSEVNRLLSIKSYNFILAMGDDTTDEDMFNALPDNAITIKIGNLSGVAKFNLLKQPDTLSFLKMLSNYKD
ncbi:MAG: bifunctional alpha,alpha-trehalose-phosphate synthase (UDP-forming)/trehalose-phosphatase [Bacteroidales bacterium]|jgi:trehalose 6-phosphate synthase/phosphatase